MRTSLKGLGAVAAAGLVGMAGHSAFTDSNTVVPSIAGYGNTTATGVTLTGVNYTPAGWDNALLSALDFTTSTDLTGVPGTVNASVTLWQAAHSGTAVATFTCAVTKSATSTIHCDLTATPTVGSANPAIASFDSVSLTVNT
ncbi:MAG: hypothetical protein ACTHMS_12240 [Jatrophihabitans sp.]|uniref:hypothetical protein n=1 Tax=Jatrophihabitans sp. TaxID=1932789 RepID=UPI003F80EAA7